MSVVVEQQGRVVRSDRCGVTAESAGDGRWTVRQLPGRSFTRAAMLGVVEFADFIGRGADVVSVPVSTWRVLSDRLRPAGLSLREAAYQLGLPSWRDLPASVRLWNELDPPPPSARGRAAAALVRWRRLGFGTRAVRG